MTDTSSPTRKRKASSKKSMSDSHKQALSEGRQQSRAVSEYLEALKVASQPKPRGRQRTPETIEARLDAINEELASNPSPLQEISLIQERLDLQEEMERKRSQESVNPDDYLPGFIEAVKPFSERKGISYAAWRELGVPPRVLKEAGIARSTR
jgi:hypothetical protein